MNAAAVRVEGLSKRYALGERQQYKSLRETIAAGLIAPSRLFRPTVGATTPLRWASTGGHVWALNDVTFDIPEGAVLGIIGSNGAGKSTLLKIISRITEPTAGKVILRGRVGSLLEVGTGFHPELTGRENIFLNGAILGMRNAEIVRKFDEIVAFAEMDQFIDTTVKHYSTGMYMRLAFAVAAHLEPDILIIDEVLAVGDASFQRKCLGKMGSVAQSGRTVLFVSHNMDAIQRLCTYSIHLEHGQLTAAGPTSTVVAQYLAAHITTQLPNTPIALDNAERRGTGEARVTSVQYASDNANTGFRPYTHGPLQFTLQICADQARSVRSVGIRITNRAGTVLVDADSLLAEQTVSLDVGMNEVTIWIEHLYLNPGEYTVGIRLANPIGPRPTSGALDYLPAAFQFEVISLQSEGLAAYSEAVVPCTFTVI